METDTLQVSGGQNYGAIPWVSREESTSWGQWFSDLGDRISQTVSAIFSWLGELFSCCCGDSAVEDRDEDNSFASRVTVPLIIREDTDEKTDVIDSGEEVPRLSNPTEVANAALGQLEEVEVREPKRHWGASQPKVEPKREKPVSFPTERAHIARMERQIAKLEKRLAEIDQELEAVGLPLSMYQISKLLGEKDPMEELATAVNIRPQRANLESEKSNVQRELDGVRKDLVSFKNHLPKIL
ncbi:MAG: hypothetical protein KDK64_03230 [Chlamydiia bacterium]|nr:hypothetical protein [Chlamydiia bacterium]